MKISMAYRPPGSRSRIAANSSKPKSGLQLTRVAPKPTEETTPDINNEELFPTISNESTEICPCGQTLDYVAAMATENEEQKVEPPPDDGVPPGWVAMRTSDRRIIRKCSPPRTSEIASPRTVSRVIGEMVGRWQLERDDLNELLGDMSPYWNAMPIGEEIEDDT